MLKLAIPPHTETAESGEINAKIVCIVRLTGPFVGMCYKICTLTYLGLYIISLHKHDERFNDYA